MATVRNPLPFTTAFGVSTESLQEAGLFDPVLNIDTLLFIDPLLLAGSQHPLISGAANDKYRQRFSQIYRLLAVRPRTDIVVAALERLVRFREIAGTCLGYTADGISGHGFGPAKSERFYAVATQVEEVGRSDPDLLPVLAVLESGIGPDLISDMTTNIIIDEIAEITKTFSDKHEIPTERFSIHGKEYQLPRNPCVTNRAVPVILVPNDILRDLPVADSWADVVILAEHNAALRQRFDANVLEIMRDQRLSAPVRRERASEEIMRDSEAVARAGEHIASLPRHPYDVVEDPQSFRAIQRLVGKVERDNPAIVNFLQQPNSPEEMAVLVEQVIEQFRHLVEDKGYWKMLWNGDRRLPEATAQRIFFAIAHSYCAHYDVRIEVEHDTGEGRIDFVFSRGKSIVIVVELKWSNNQGLLRGYSKQVDRYLKSERTNAAFYLVLDCDNGGKYEAFTKTIAGQPNGLIAVKHVDANRRTSPSKKD